MPEWQYNGVQTALSQKTPNTWKKEKEAELKATELPQNAPHILEKYLPHLKRMNSWVMFTLPAKERWEKMWSNWVHCKSPRESGSPGMTARCYEMHPCLLTPSNLPEQLSATTTFWEHVHPVTTVELL